MPNERIRHTDKFDDPNLPGEMQTTVSLKQMFCGTELNIVQEGIPEAIPPEACYLGWQESLTLLARNEADLVVMGRAPANLDCEATPFATNPLAIVAAPDHALVRRKHLPFSALADYSFVVREEGSGTHAAMERLFAQHQTPLRVVMEMPCNESIEQAVMAGMGLSFLSMRTVRHELASGHLALLDIEGMPLMGNGYITHLSQKKLSPAATSFKAFLIEQGGPLINSWA